MTSAHGIAWKHSCHVDRPHRDSLNTSHSLETSVLKPDSLSMLCMAAVASAGGPRRRARLYSTPSFMRALDTSSAQALSRLEHPWGWPGCRMVPCCTSVPRLRLVRIGCVPRPISGCPIAAQAKGLLDCCSGYRFGATVSFI